MIQSEARERASGLRIQAGESRRNLPLSLARFRSLAELKAGSTVEDAEVITNYRSILADRNLFNDALATAVSNIRTDPEDPVGGYELHLALLEMALTSASNVLEHAESPIEQALFLSLVLVSFGLGHPIIVCPPEPDVLSYIESRRKEYEGLGGEDIEKVLLDSIVHVTLQAAFLSLRFRVDALAWRPFGYAPVVIECDGFDYHSDKAAFTKDRVRDRAFQEMGFRVVRFSGSEIHQNPIKAGTQLLRVLVPPSAGVTA